MKPYRILVTIFLAVGALKALPSTAHDFWLAPDAYVLEKPDTVPVSIKVGHPEDLLNWPVNPTRIVGLRTISRDGITDQQAAIEHYTADKTVPIKLQSKGLHILTIETTNAYSSLPAEKFENYLEKEGLTLLQLDRVREGLSDAPGTELYSRRGKAILQVGSVSAQDIELLRRPIGLTLEIVAQDHPQLWRDGESLDVQLFYRGKPAKGVTVKLANTSLEVETGVTRLTKKDGMASFEYPGPGTWMFHAIWGEKETASDRADYNTIFSSLSFVVQ